MGKTVIKARDVMNASYITLDGIATVKEALLAMKDADANVVIVNKRDEHDAYGFVLLADIVKKVLACDRAPERVNVYEIMSKPGISLESDLDVRYCARLFDRFGLSNAPVIEDGKVSGVVSYKELVYNGLCKLMETP